MTDKFLDGRRVSVDEFIAHHTKTHINYCECIIFPNGDVQYGVPSHQEALIKATGIEREKLFSMMNEYDDVLKVLLNLTGCVSVWYSRQIYAKELTPEQNSTLTKLSEFRCIMKDVRNVDSCVFW